MRAVHYDRFGPPEILRVDAVDEPVPAAGEAKVRVRAASLNPLDWKIRDGHLALVPLLARPPRGTGCDFAGEIVAVGGGAASRHVGERVVGSLSPFGRQGSCAEYVTVRADALAPLPPGLPFPVAATLPIAAGTAVQAIDDEARVGPGMRVLVTGAAGGVGHFAVQLARHRGAHVVGVCGPGNVGFVRELGADEVVDYTRGEPLPRSPAFDFVFDAANAIRPHDARDLLRRGGLYIGTSGSASAAIATALGTVMGAFSGVRIHNFVLRPGAAMWRRLVALADAGTLVPHVAATIGLADVAEAQRRMAGGHGRGKIVVVP